MNKIKIREAVAAGTFYPSSRKMLEEQIARFTDSTVPKKDCIACILPHAGYIYSGNVAIKTLSRIQKKEKVLLLGPNHTGLGAEFSIMTEGSWRTPLGTVPIDETLAKILLASSAYLKEDSLAHEDEHSIEVELPLLQNFMPNFSMVPICIMPNIPTALKELGKNMALAIKKNHLERDIQIIASSDMTHYEPLQEAMRKDMLAIQAILELNEDKLAKRVSDMNISMCGVAPVIVMLSAAKELGATKGELILYQTSGDTTGDKTSVVGYAGIIIN